MTEYNSSRAAYENQCVELLLERLDAFLFDYDIVRDEMTVRRAVGAVMEKRIENYRRNMQEGWKGAVHPDFVEPLIVLLSGHGQESQEFLLDVSEHPKGRYRWYQVLAKPIQDETGHTVRTQGIFWDVESTTGTSEHSYARFRSERDPVTGIYNAQGLAKAVDAYIVGQGRDERNVLLAMQLANFPQLAKEHGKRWADQILTRICKSMGGLFREGDVLAHLGNGLFAVFMKAVERTEVVDSKAEAIVKLFRHDNMIYGSYGIVCEVAMAFYTEDGATTEALLATAMHRLNLSAS